MSQNLRLNSYDDYYLNEYIDRVTSFNWFTRLLWPNAFENALTDLHDATSHSSGGIYTDMAHELLGKWRHYIKFGNTIDN